MHRAAGHGDDECNDAELGQMPGGSPLGPLKRAFLWLKDLRQITCADTSVKLNLATHFMKSIGNYSCRDTYLFNVTYCGKLSIWVTENFITALKSSWKYRLVDNLTLIFLINGFRDASSFMISCNMSLM